MKLRFVLSGSVAVAAFVGATSLALAQEHSPFPVPQARPPMRTLVDQMSPQERMELRKQLRQHAREHGLGPQPAPAVVPQNTPVQIIRPQPMQPVIQNSNAQNSPPQSPPPQQNPNNAKEADRLSGIERAQLRAQLREAKMREEQDRDAKQLRRNNGNKGPNQPPPK